MNNRELSILTIKKSQNKLKTSSLSHRKTSQKGLPKLRKKDTTLTETKQEQENKKEYTCSMNNCDSLSLVQGPSTVTCMIGTSLS
jgi:hypothetical protein